MKYSIYKKFLIFCLLIFLFCQSVLPIINSTKINYTDQKNDNDLCDLLILAPSHFKNSLQPLVCHKNKKLKWKRP